MSDLPSTLQYLKQHGLLARATSIAVGDVKIELAPDASADIKALEKLLGEKKGKGDWVSRNAGDLFADGEDPAAGLL